jgi:hypothetical protein
MAIFLRKSWGCNDAVITLQSGSTIAQATNEPRNGRYDPWYVKAGVSMTPVQSLELRVLATTWDDACQRFRWLGMMNTPTDPVARLEQTFQYEKARTEMLVAEHRLLEFQASLVRMHHE